MWDSLLFCAVRGAAAAAAVNSWTSWLWIPKLPSPLLSNPHFWALPNLFVFVHSSSRQALRGLAALGATAEATCTTWTKHIFLRTRNLNFVSSGSGFLFEPFGLERLSKELWLTYFLLTYLLDWPVKNLVVLHTASKCARVVDETCPTTDWVCCNCLNQHGWSYYREYACGHCASCADVLQGPITSEMYAHDAFTSLTSEMHARDDFTSLRSLAVCKTNFEGELPTT